MKNDVDIKYLNQFEAQMTDAVMKYCKGKELLGDRLLETPDLDQLWEANAAEYLADAVKEVIDYPLVSIGWASYLGIAAAMAWDKNWEDYRVMSKIFYTSLRDRRGFDCFDEYVTEEILGIPLYSDDNKKLQENLMGIAQLIIDLIRREGAEPSSVMAYHMFTRASRVAFKTGVALCLFQLGYKYKQVK